MDDDHSQIFHKRAGKGGGAALAVTAIVGAMGVGGAAVAEHKYMQRTGSSVPNTHRYDSSSSRERRKKGGGK